MNQTQRSEIEDGSNFLRLETPSDFSDFELLDSGGEEVLERWGQVKLVRPSPQAIWTRHMPDVEWQKASAVFASGKKEQGGWQIKQPLPNPWVVEYKGCRFLLKLTPFKHTGLFAEQAAQWAWTVNKISNFKFQISKETSEQKSKLRILNLFAYTGGATMMLARASCFVTHVDASKPAIAWAKENHMLNNLPADSARWILDDAVKFVKREVKRGARYDGIIMDPPAFGHGPSGKVWKFNEHLPSLLADCVTLLSEDPIFLLINGYATNSSALALGNLLEDATAKKPGKIEFGELCLRQKDDRLLSTGIFSRWSP